MSNAEIKLTNYLSNQLVKYSSKDNGLFDLVKSTTKNQEANKLANILDVSRGAVLSWSLNSSKLPAKKILAIELASQGFIRRWDMNSELYPKEFKTYQPSSTTLKEAIEDMDMSLTQFSEYSSVPYHTLSSHVNRNTNILAKYVLYIEALTDGRVSKTTIRPDLYPEYLGSKEYEEYIFFDEYANNMVVEHVNEYVPAIIYSGYEYSRIPFDKYLNRCQ